MTKFRLIACSACSIFTALLSACALGPDYQRPDVAVPSTFKEQSTQISKPNTAEQIWQIAAPQDEQERSAWWLLYQDAQLNELIGKIELSNQNVQIAAAQYRQAQALSAQADSAFFPSLSTSASSTRNSANAAGGSINNTSRVALNASWEVDVWGRIARGAEAGAASAEAARADLQAALLSAQASLAQSYFQLRASDAQSQLFERSVAAYTRALEITQNRYAAGVAGRSDVVQAKAQLKSTEAQALELNIARAQFEHAIAVLIGQAPANLTLVANPQLPSLPTIPPSLPATLLERRPDIAAAERRVAAANAQIGVAQAAFFPALSLSASGGYQSNHLADLFNLPNRFWSLGPALALSLFDAGARSAKKEQSMAAYDQTVAAYRQTVLVAFQGVEDNLAALRILADEAGLQQAALEAAQESLKLTQNKYLAGSVSYLDVVSTQASALAAERTLISIQNQRLLASAALLKALGGEWSAVIEN